MLEEKDWEQPIKKTPWNEFLVLCTRLLHNKYEVFYGDDFPKKKQEMLGSNVLSQDLHD